MINKLQEIVKDFDYNNQEHSENFFEIFSKLFLEYDFSCGASIDFLGEGCYFGKVILVDFNHHFAYHLGTFEIAFSEEHATIYRGNHNGFWVPAYVTLSGESWKIFWPSFKNKLRKHFGVD